MPTYEYACRACGQHLEVVQSFKDSPLTECPACGGSLRKVFGNIGIAFKGDGFYRTDSRSSSTKPAAKGAEAKVSESGTSSSEKGAGSEKGGTSQASGGDSGSGTTASSNAAQPARSV